MYFAPFAANSQGVGEAPIVLVPTPLTMRASDVIRRADRDAVIDAVSLAEQADRSLADSRGAARLAALLAFVALLLSTSGVYGVVSYSVEQRRREIGTRMALGARPREVIVLILRRNGTPLWMDLVAGLVLTAGASSALRGQLYGLYPLDPAVSVGLIAILGFAGFAASAIPARRALRVDPVETLQLD
jgi:ABC-type lipoprotein release transport system permease subunit